MSEFTSESLTVLFSIIVFGILLSITFWAIPQVVDILIRVAEASVK